MRVEIRPGVFGGRQVTRRTVCACSATSNHTFSGTRYLWVKVLDSVE